ncbi:MAG: NifU family protein [Bacilli bacterium]|nr:NifU family protein [Bacilli bacterium]
METIQKIKDILDLLRPFLISDGGDLEFIKYEDNIVYIKMLGACAGCFLLDSTLKDGIEVALMEEIPEIKAVIAIEEGEL